MEHESLRQKIERGWSLTRSSWLLVCKSGVLLVLPFLWLVVWLALLLGYAKLGLGMYVQKQGAGSYWLGSHIGLGALPWLLVFYAGAVLLNTLFVAVISHNVLMRLADRAVSPTDTMRAVRRQFGPLASFALFSSGVSFLLVSLLGRFSFARGLLGWLSNAAWQTGTIFAVPAIMAVPEAEKITPLKATKKSAAIIKKVWGEGVTYRSAVSVIALLTFMGTYIATTVVERILYGAFHQAEAVVIVGAIVGVLLFLVEFLLFTLLAMVTRTVLFAYAEHRAEPKGFDKKMLRATITSRKAQKLFS